MQLRFEIPVEIYLIFPFDNSLTRWYTKQVLLERVLKCVLTDAGNDFSNML